MARQIRLNIPDAYYHVMTRGIDGVKIFEDDEDRNKILECLEEALLKTASQCHAWALMSNHIHLLIKTTQKPLSKLIQQFLAQYAVYFNIKYKRKGYLFQGRFKSVLCQKDPYFMELVRYIHLNPIRAHIVDNVEMLSKYPWTGHSVICGEIERKWQIKREILEWFGREQKPAINNYCRFILDGMGQEASNKNESAFGRGFNCWIEKDRKCVNEKIIGEPHFVDAVMEKAKEELEKPAKHKNNGWDIEKLACKICQMMRISLDEMHQKGRGNKKSYARGLLAYWGQEELGFKGSDIARYLKISKSSISEAYIRGRAYVLSEKLNLTSLL